MCKRKLLIVSAVVAVAVGSIPLIWRMTDKTEPTEPLAPSGAKARPLPVAVKTVMSRPCSTNQTPTVRGTLPYVLTSAEPFTKPLRVAAEALGARTAGVLSRNALLVEADAATRARLAADGRFEDVAEYLPASKVQPALVALVSGGAKAVDVSIVSLAAEDRERVIACLKAGGGEMLEGCINEGGTIRANLPTELVSELALRGDVCWLERFERPHLMNDVAVEPAAMNVRAVWDTHGLTGAGQNISTSDTGIDTGNLTTMHRDLRNRVKAIKVVADCDTSDDNGHGTHTAGSIVGDGTESGGLIRGTAHGANLYAWFGGYQGGSNIRTPSTLSSLYTADGAWNTHIHSASWGHSTRGEYDAACANHDTYVWNNPEFLPVFSAGNSGNAGGRTIGSPAAAKNVLAVGATQSQRSGFDGGWGNGNPETRAKFSSRGPCKDGRIKPDVASPGVGVLSTRSSKASYSYDYNNYYAYSSGTSMACPLTAGAVALVRQWLVERKGFADAAGRRPTAALMKAVIMGGAKGASVPNNEQGWGRVDLEETLFPSGGRKVKLVDRIPFAQGFVTNIVIETTSAAPLDVQLVWVDYPGSEAGEQAASRLVNDIDLCVTEVGGFHYGNGGTTPDTLNNAESVRITDAAAGKYAITVNCKTILHDYAEGGAAALYICGAFDPEAEIAIDEQRTETVNGVTWTYTVKNGVAAVGGEIERAVPMSMSGAITIPSSLGGYPVVGISALAFFGCGGLTAVTIPPGVTNIGKWAFYGCSGLKSVTIPPSVTSIGDDAFSGCSGLKSVTIPACVTRLSSTFPASYASITDVVIGEGVTSIAESAFLGCGSLRNVTIPSSVTNIGSGAFYGCGGLARVTLPSSVASIGHEAFSGNGGLVEISVDADSPFFTSVNGMLLTKDGTKLVVGVNGNVTIPPCVTSIGGSAFCGCANLTSVTIPSSVTNIGAIAFYNCTALTSVTIPSSVTSIGSAAFSNCSGLGNGVVYADGCVLCVNGNCPDVLELRKGTRLIADGVFRECRSLTSVTIPDGVTSIDGDAFRYCSGLKSVVLPSSVTSIGSYAFGSCGAIRSATVPAGVKRLRDIFPSAYNAITSVVISEGETSVMDNMFHSCRALESVTISEGVTSIGSGAFYGCSSLTSVTIPASVTNIGHEAFSNNGSLMEILADADSQHFRSVNGMLLTKDGTELVVGVNGDVTIPSGVTSIGTSAFSGCGGLTSVTIPPSVTNIGAIAFYNCSALTSVTIPSSVRSICDTAFCRCTGLTSVTLPDSVTSIGMEAFRYCGGLKSVALPSSVTSIGNWAFADCDGLASVTIPASVKSIGYAAFYHCDALASVTVQSGVTSIGDWAFGSCGSLTSVTIPSSVTSIGENTYRYCGNIRSATVPSGVKKLSVMFPASYASITNVVICEGVTSVMASMFADCTALESVTIPSGVKSIGKSAFSNCRALAALTIPSSVTSIGTSAFANCGAIRDVTIPYCVTKLSSTFPASYASITNVAICEGVTSVKASVFSGCSTLTSVTLPSSVTSIGSSAFSGCGALTSIAISSRVRSIGESAFSGCSGLKTVFVDPCDLDRVKALMAQSGADVSSLTFVETWDPALAVSTDCLPCGVTGFVYSCALSAEGGTEPYSWEIIGSGQESEYVESREASTFSSSGTAQGWQYDDKCWTYALPFAFPFYGKKYSTVYVSSNGTLAFDGSFYGYSESEPELKKHAMIAAQWDDLNTSSGNIYVTKTSDSVTFRWVGSYYSGANAVNFAVTLYADGRIRLSYGSGNANGGLVGISAGDGENCLVSSCSQKGSLAYAEDVVIEKPLRIEVCKGVSLSEDGVLSGTPSEVSSNLVDVMVTDALGKKNHRKLPLVIWDKLPDGVYSQVVDGVEWCFAISEGFATVGVLASEGAVAKSTAGALAVPAALGNCPVTGIAAAAFRDCANLGSVVIPSGVTSIGDHAFDGCSSLTNVLFCGNAPTAGLGAFDGVADGCTATVYEGTTGWDDDGDGKWQGLTLRRVPRPDGGPYEETVDGLAWTFGVAGGVASVGGGSRDATAVAKTTTGSVTIPPTLGGAPVTGIRAYAFSGCSELTSVTIPSGVTNVGASAFENCSAIRSVTIPACVTRLSSAFPASYASITNVVICEGVTSIGSSAFSGCSGLTAVTIPSSVTSVGSSAFYGCGGLRTVCVEPDDVARMKKLLSQAGASVSTVTFVEMWNSVLSISPDRLPNGSAGFPYSALLTADGGTGPYSWQIRTHQVTYSERREGGTFSSSGGTAQAWQSDEADWSYALPFPFTFYGKKYTKVYVSANGTIAFDSSFHGYGAGTSEMKKHALIAAMWADLKTTSPGDIFVASSEREITFRWSGIYYQGGTSVNFAVTLYADGRIRLSYGSGNSKGGLVGISAGDGETYLLCSCNQGGSLSDAMDVVIDRDRANELSDGISLSEGGLISGTPIGACSNRVDVMVTDAQGKKNHREFLLLVTDAYPDGVYSNEIGGVEWHFAIGDGKATVGGPSTGGAVAKATAGALTVPAELGRCPVTCVGAQAFSGCAELTSVEIPAGVTEIGAEAFAGCGSLTNVVFSEDAPPAAPDAFADVAIGCTATVPIDAKGWDDDGDGKWQGLALRSVPRTESVDGVLWTFSVSDGWATIEHGGYESLSGAVVIPSSLAGRKVAGVGEHAFDGCSGLTSVTIPEGVASIGSSAFLGCSGLAHVAIPSSVTNVGTYAFQQCGLTSVTIPEGVTGLVGTFVGCSLLESATLPSSVRFFGSGTFCGCSSLKSVTIPTEARGIDSYTFKGCVSLTNIEIPSGVTYIGEGAFEECTSLELVKMYNGVADIGDHAFADCVNLTTVRIPASVAHVGYGAFDRCYGLGDGVVTIDGCVLAVNDACLDEVVIPSGVRLFADKVFSGHSELTRVTLPQSMTSISKRAFEFCTGLSSVKIPSGVTNIAQLAFNECSALTNVVFGGNAPTAEESAFDGVADGCTATVYAGTTGWDYDGNGLWQGLALVYRVDPIPYLGENPTKDQIETALSESADLRLAANITNGAGYAAYREWALAVTNASGQAVGAAAVKESPNAWLSFALGCGTLIEKAPERGDLKVESVEFAADGAVELTISVKGIEVGPVAAAENLKRIFGLEGGASLEEMSPAGVDIEFGTPENGRVKCTVKPKGDGQASFFMKARMDL